MACCTFVPMAASAVVEGAPEAVEVGAQRLRAVGLHGVERLRRLQSREPRTLGVTDVAARLCRPQAGQTLVGRHQGRHRLVKARKRPMHTRAP